MAVAFWLCVLGLAHSYVFFPFLMKRMARGRVANALVFSKNEPENWPFLTVLMSVFNEQKVIAAKLENFAALDWPREKMQILIGSDCSTDATDAIVRAFLAENPDVPIGFFPFEKRRGKPPVVNELAELAFSKKKAGGDHVFLLTDASVMLDPEAVFELLKHFRNPEIGAVDAVQIGTGLQKAGISRSENQYMNRETRLKTDESRALGLMMGPFGGCYALRSDLFEPVPPNSLVDDFWLVLNALSKGFRAINEPEAHCFEGATHALEDEFRRKKRIAAGSFQNLARFKKLVLPPATWLGFVFFSHKVLRWFGGFLLAGMWLTSGFLAFESLFFRWVFGLLTVGFLGLPLLDFLCKSFRINVLAVRSGAYFVAMNAALVVGFFKFLSGIKTNVWQPTRRY